MTLTIFLPHTLSAAIIESIEDEQRSYGLEFISVSCQGNISKVFFQVLYII